MNLDRLSVNIRKEMDSWNTIGPSWHLPSARFRWLAVHQMLHPGNPAVEQLLHSASESFSDIIDSQDAARMRRAAILEQPNVMTAEDVQYLFAAQHFADCDRLLPRFFLDVAKEQMTLSSDPLKRKQALLVAVEAIMGGTHFFTQQISSPKKYRKLLHWISDMILAHGESMPIDAAVEGLLAAHMLGEPFAAEAQVEERINHSPYREVLRIQLHDIYRAVDV